MNKKNIFSLIIFCSIVIGIIAFLVYKSNQNNSNEIGEADYNSARTSQNTTDENLTNDTTDNNTQSPEEIDIGATDNSTPPKESEIASFKTKIYTKDSGRQNNISIACSTLNDTIVENGSTFSFSNTVGKATSGKGYKKADVFRNGDVVEALGGGLCQVSTTLYNAVLKVSGLKVTERHPHSNKVPYIKSGKDAAVSYGSQDFKFVNNTGNSIKIKAENTKDYVTIKLLKLE